MSLIEAAVEKAKRLGKGGKPHLTEQGEASVIDRGRPRSSGSVDAATVDARSAQARVIPVSGVDADAMERSGILLNVSDAAAHRSYRILRTRVQQRMQLQGWHSLGITAPGAGEGKSVTAINLAVSLARDINTWVSLVDLDLQHPKIAAYLGLKPDKGLGDFIGGYAKFDEILYNPGVERLTVVPNRQVVEDSSDVLGTPRIRELCNLLSAEQPRPLIIYDLPPLLVTDDVMKFAPNMDCILLVVSEGKTSRAVLQRAKEVLQEMNLLGVVLNRSAEREESGYY